MLPPKAPLSILDVSTKESQHLEWFRRRTASKLPGSFICEFWETLLFQASLKEPAVLHAVLALSSVHKSGTLALERPKSKHVNTNEEEQFTLQQYVQAIGHLQPHFLVKDRASFRVALISCIVFVCMELLRGHFETAQCHLQNGLKVLEEVQLLAKPPSDRNDGVRTLKPRREPVDEWIFEAFCRLAIQVALFNKAFRHSCIDLHVGGLGPPGPRFYGLNDAWQHLQHILNRTFQLAEQVSRQNSTNIPTVRASVYTEQQEQILLDLAGYLVVYKASKKTLEGEKFTQAEKAHKLLRLYHILATIMANTCLHPNDESIFDSQTDQFVSLVKQATGLAIVSAEMNPLQPIQGHAIDMSRSITDLGWIAPLFYAATKCRIPRVRLHAIKLIESSSHREGIWDGGVAVCIARKVMDIENQGFYRPAELAEDFSIFSNPRPQDLSLPILPQTQRVSMVEVVFSGDPMETILLHYEQLRADSGQTVGTWEYSIASQRWKDRGSSVVYSACSNWVPGSEEQHCG